MDDEDYTNQSAWNSEEEYKKSLEDQFSLCLKQIENKTKVIPDNELGPVEFINKQAVYQGVNDLSFLPAIECIGRGNRIPIDAAKEIIKIIVIYLNSGWEIPQKMREYLSSRLERSVDEDESIGKKGENLQSLFHLRKTTSSKIADDISSYISFRFKVRHELTKVSKSAYLKNNAFHLMVSDEIKSIFGEKETITQPREIENKRRQSSKGEYFYGSVSAFLLDNLDNVNKYEGYLIAKINKGRIRGVNQIGDELKFMIFTLEWIEKSMKK